MQDIGVCLWFNGQAEEAGQFYKSIFKNVKIGKSIKYSADAAQVSGNKEGTVMSVEYEIEGLKVLGLNGGPLFKFNPSFSFFVWCKTEEEINEYWKKISDGGEVRMALDKYPFADKYFFAADKFGVNWQCILKPDIDKKIAPAFLFVKKVFGKGEEAINYYASIFKNSKIEVMHKDEKTKTVMHSMFTLGGRTFVLMEGQGDHDFGFNEAFSLVVHCDNQAEIDEYWSKLSANGWPGECGWLKDKFGVAWQIVPKQLGAWLTADEKKAERIMAAVLKMQKIDIKTLENA